MGNSLSRGRNESDSIYILKRSFCKCILLSERSQSEKATSGIIPAIWHSGKDRTVEIVKRSVIARG